MISKQTLILLVSSAALSGEIGMEIPADAPG